MSNRYNRIAVSLKDAILTLRYKELVLFLNDISTLYYEGIDVFTKDGWMEVFYSIKDNHLKYDINKEIKYVELRENIATIIEKNYNKKKYAYEAMNLAFNSYNRGDKKFRLIDLISGIECLED